MTPLPRDTAPLCGTSEHVFSHVESDARRDEARAFLAAAQGTTPFEGQATLNPHLPAAVRERLAQAGPSAQLNVQRFNDRFAKKREVISALFQELQSKHHKKLDALKKLRAAAHDFSTTATPVSACKAKCQHCCHIPVALSQSEARLIGKQIQVQPLEPKESRWLRDKPYGYEHPCPFLTATGCSIYADRPLACRVHLNMDQDDLLCQLIPGASVPVPLANASSFYMLYAKITEGDFMGDIREFFPHGKHNTQAQK